VSWRTIHRSTASRQAAVIDLGSNSWRLVVFAFQPGAWWKQTDELYETVRIGEGLGASGVLADAAIARGLETLDVFGRFCQAHELAPADICAVATSAIRDATNRQVLLDGARERTGLSIEVLSAEAEARYGYLAAVNTTTLTDGAVVELGGGSLQLVAVADRRARESTSLALGAVRLTERFLSEEGKPSSKAIKRLRTHVRDELSELGWLRDTGRRLVAVGGAARNLATAAQRRAELPHTGIQGYLLTADVLGELVDELAGLPAAERRRVPGIKPGRGDIILAAALTLQTVLETGGFDCLEVTEAGLREGVFLANTLLAGADPLLGDVRPDAVRNLAALYEEDLPHVEHVAELSLQMHDSLRSAGVVEASEGERELLWAAAMLHDIGMAVSYDDHHKHSQYLIMQADLPGFDPRERALIGLMSRYHRKGTPKLGDVAPLARAGDEALLARCAAILRLAEHLERGRDGSVSAVRLRTDGDDIDLHLQADGDLTLARWSVERYGDDRSFERVFGRRLLIG
jgi:exopolyphosphatase/guanosine-5'-triphosphate,3'-diphosphate pyrophosphatase